MKKKIFLIIIAMIINLMVINAETSFINDEERGGNYGSRYSYIDLFNSSLFIYSDGSAKILIELESTEADRCKLKGYLQKYSNGSWKTIKRFSNISYSNSCELNKKYYANNGYDYRIVAYAYVYKNGSILESAKIVENAVYE